MAFHPVSKLSGHLNITLAESGATEKAKNYYSQALLDHKETWLNFDWEDIRYIIVPDEASLKRIIEQIKELPLGDTQRYLLISRIEVSMRFSEDLT